jgi:hypothetical protein
MVPPYLGDQDAVALADAHGQAVALLVEQPGADGEDLGLVELLDARLGEEDAAGGLGLGLDALNQDAVEEGGEGADGANRSGLFVVRVLVSHKMLPWELKDTMRRGAWGIAEDVSSHLRIPGSIVVEVSGRRGIGRTIVIRD